MNNIFAGICCFFLSLLAVNTQAQDRMDTLAIEEILREEIRSWNSGDAVAYSKHFAENGTFTNILGMFFTGYKAFRDRHIEIFKGRFSNTKLTQSIVSFQFLRNDVAIVETFTVLTGFSSDGPPPGI